MSRYVGRTALVLVLGGALGAVGADATSSAPRAERATPAQQIRALRQELRQLTDDVNVLNSAITELRQDRTKADNRFTHFRACIAGFQRVDRVARPGGPALDFVEVGGAPLAVLREHRSCGVS